LNEARRGRAAEIASSQFSVLLPAKEEPLVHAALQSIPEEAVKRGVFPENALRERFLKVITFPFQSLRARVAAGRVSGVARSARDFDKRTPARLLGALASPYVALAGVVLPQPRKKSRDETTLPRDPRALRPTADVYETTRGCYVPPSPFPAIAIPESAYRHVSRVG